jgi:hypothetical protein
LSKAWNRTAKSGQIIILSGDGTQKGKVINWRAKHCQLESCRNYRASVRWEDGSLTYPCHAGLKQVNDTTYQIELP